MSSNNGWEPRTRLGKQVVEGEIDSMQEALNSGLPLKESEVVDQLVPDLEDEVLDINMVQRMTDSGRRVKFRCVVAVGNRDGLVGYAEGRDDQVGGAIQKAIDVAKLNIIDVSRGCGSWECGCGRPHTVALRTEGNWTRSSGNTRTTVNFAKATFNALQNTAEARVPERTFEKREVIE